MSDLKHVRIKRDEISSDEANDLFNAAREQLFERIDQREIEGAKISASKCLDLVRHFNKLAGGNSPKNKLRQTQGIGAEVKWRRGVACSANRSAAATVCF